MPADSEHRQVGLLARLNRRGVFRVGASYAVIAWLLLQIGDVVLDPFDFGDAVMRVVLIVVALGFPVAITLAWMYELTPGGMKRDRQRPDEIRPAVSGVRQYADLAVIGVLVVIVALLLADRGGMIVETPTQPVVAVLPFANMSPEAEDAYFGEGVADTLIHKLGQLDNLVVLASQSTFQFKGRDLDLGDVGSKLGATTIMTGSVQRSGSALRVNARLVEVDSGRQLWSNSFDRQLQDVFAIQDEIAAATVDALQVVLAPEGRERIAENATNDLTAYDAYVIGKARLATRTPQNREAALAYFRTAVEQDPEYALAWAGLTEALFLVAERGLQDSGRLQRLWQEAEAASQTAVRLAPELGDAWLAKALSSLMEQESFDNRNIADAEIAEMFEKAIEFGPNNALAYKYYSNFCSDSGTMIECERDEASLLMNAARLDPRSGIIKVNIGQRMEEAGRDEEAARWYRESLTTHEPFFRQGNFMLSWFELEQGRPVEVALRNRSQFRQWPGEYPSFMIWLTALMDLGAWNEVSDALDTMMVENRDVPLDYSHFGMPLTWEHLNTLFRHRVSRATGRWEAAEALAQKQLAYYEGQGPSWPQLPFFMSEQAVATMMGVDLGKGNPDLALERVEAAYPDRSGNVERAAPDPLDPLWMRAALLKQVGQARRSEQMLRQHLAFLDAEEEAGEHIRVGWSRFMAYALIGERQAALDELERIADTPYHHRWYDLETYSFDPDYQEVLGAPRFVVTFNRIKARADRLREEEFMGSE